MNNSERPEYRVWAKMRARCRHRDNKNYGGRGILVCERWGAFEKFFADMGPRPSIKHSIEREDVNGNYEPGNCRWATHVEQMRNTRVSVTVDLYGECVNVSAKCEQLGMSYQTVYMRLRRGMTPEQAFNIGRIPGPLRAGDIPRAGNRSGYRGVSPKRGRWIATITFDGKTRRLGTFATPEDANYAATAVRAEQQAFYASRMAVPPAETIVTAAPRLE